MPVRPRFLWFGLLTALMLSASACTTAQDTGTLRIVATPWSLQWLASELAPDAEVLTVGTAGQDAHDTDLGPADREVLQSADVLLYLGPIGFQPQVEAVAAERGEQALALSDDTAEARADIHLWFEASLLADFAEVLATRLSEIDPDREAGYRSRAQTVAKQLRELEGEIDQRLASCTHDTVVVSHAAFARLLAPRGITQVGITPSGTSGHHDASPARIAELATMINEKGLQAVLAEPGEGRAAAEALARETGVPVKDIDALEAPTDDARPLGFPALLRAQVEVFAQALECADA